MFFILLLTIISASPISRDTVELKGIGGITYRMMVVNNEFSFQYRLKQNWSEPTKLDSGDISEYSVALTTGDYLHIVWCKAGRVCYRMNDEPITPISVKDNRKPQLSPFIFISSYFTEPASNLTLEVSGEWINIGWRSTNEEDNQNHEEIWQRRKRMDWPVWQWTTPENKSRAIHKN